MSKFIATSRQATELDKTRILMEWRIQEVKDENKKWVEVAAKAKDDAKELQFTNLLDTNYAMGFEDFKMEAMENFPKVDFSSIKLNLGGAATSSLL